MSILRFVCVRVCVRQVVSLTSPPLCLCRTPLMLAVLNGHAECVFSLLSHGASVEHQDRWGRTALHRGVGHQRRAGSPSCWPWKPSLISSTISFAQAATGQEECVEALLQRGASVCVRDVQGRSPLHLASACGRVGALGALLQAGATLWPTQAHLTDNQGYTPLHWACYNGTQAHKCARLHCHTSVKI